jgi:hypothetical protein
VRSLSAKGMTVRTCRYGDAVTVTPVAARRDGRILKQSSSLARAGFRSILFEGQKSVPPIALPDVEIVALSAAGVSGSAGFVKRAVGKA